LLTALGILLVAMLGLPLSAVAQETEETQPVEKTDNTADTAKAAEDTGWLSNFSGIVQADFTNAYFFRGIRQERQGFIAQPWGELYYSLFKSEDGPIRNITVGAGVWNSFHSEETGHTQHPRSLYETDWYPLVSIGLPENLTLTTIYYFYTSPNDAFRSAQELNFKLAWDDSEALGKFALAPWINLAIETHRTSFGPNKGEGLQMGVAPTLYTIPIENYPITLTLPLELGLALHNYYEHADGHESAFGYFSAAGSASVPLAFVPKGFGSWSLTSTIKGYFLSNTLKNANGRQSTSGVYTGSLTLEF
jgi:hypothetical protein